MAYRGVYTIQTIGQMLHGKRGGRFLQPFQEIRGGEISVLIVTLISSVNEASFILELASIKFNLQRKLTHFCSPTTQVSATLDPPPI